MILITKRLSIVAALVALTMLSCAKNNGISYRYQAEKRFHQAEKLFNDTRLKNQYSDPDIRREVLTQFAAVVDFCYAGLDSLDAKAFPVESREIQFLTFQSSTRLSQIYYADREYDSCITILNRLIHTIPLQSTHRINSYLNLGQALHAGGQWDSAVVIYNTLLANVYPPVDNRGQIFFKLLNLPFHMYQVVLTAEGPEVAKEYGDRAIIYYQDLIEKQRGSPLEAACHANLALVYNSRGEWQKEVDQLSQIRDTSVENQIALNLKIADLYAGKMNRLQTAMTRYEDILAQLPEDDTTFYPAALFRISQVRMGQKEYELARQTLVKIRRDYPGFFNTSPASQLMMARSFEQEGNWNRAEAEYNLLVEKYRSSDEALATFLYLADYYEKDGRETEARRWYGQAEQTYDQLATRAAGTILEAKALIFKADLYRQQKQWQNSADVLVSVFEKFPNSQAGQKAALSAVSIYDKRLNNSSIADSLRASLKRSLSDIKD
jgi:tetratricopeptide (TPR) repeat protein